MLCRQLKTASLHEGQVQLLSVSAITGGSVSCLTFWVPRVNMPCWAHHLLCYDYADTFPTANLICPYCFVQRKEYGTSLDESNLL